MFQYIAGSNIFGQWQCDSTVLSEFSDFIEIIRELEISLSRANIVQINWSYNILQIDGIFYVSGFWDGKDQQFAKVPIPIEIDSTVELTVIGNDYKVILIGTNVNTLWVIDLKEQNVKKIYFNIEEPLEDVKKRKLDNNITKAVISNESCLYLTSHGNVYSGVLPSYVNTKHCKGKICDIQCGYEHFVLLTDEGRVYTWGNGRRLQLGHGDVSNQEVPMQVEAFAGIKITKISAGGWHSLALSIFGDVYAWGWNDTGQLGIKTLNKEHESFSVPTLVDLFDEHDKEYVKNVKDIACGSRHSAIILEDDTIWTTGCNKYGQLGFSEVKVPSVKYFRKAFNCDNTCSLICGPWSTLVVSK